MTRLPRGIHWQRILHIRQHQSRRSSKRCHRCIHMQLFMSRHRQRRTITGLLHYGWRWWRKRNWWRRWNRQSHSSKTCYSMKINQQCLPRHGLRPVGTAEEAKTLMQPSNHGSENAQYTTAIMRSCSIVLIQIEMRSDSQHVRGIASVVSSKFR